MTVPPAPQLVGPAILVLALGVLVLICRWVFSTTARDQRASRAQTQGKARGDYGLLVPVVCTATPREAEGLRQVLREAGIRCTLAPAAEPQGHAVLVFRADASRARELVRR